MQEQKSKLKLQSNTKKNTYKFDIASYQNKQMTISSDFDSGNIQLIKQISDSHYRLAAVSDYKNQSKNKKTWFFFKIKSFNQFKVKIVIQNVQILNPVYQSDISTKVPVYKIGNGQWCRLRDCYLSMKQYLQINIDFTFTSEEQVYFALTIPFTYNDNLNLLKNLQQKSCENHSIYYKQEILTKTHGGLFVHLLTITQKQNSSNYQLQLKFDVKLFNDQIRPIKFNKPVILMTARVHPGQVSSSHTLIGIIKFLFNQNDLRAYLLRKFFVFMIIPMVNPDGVYQGNYRMDLQHRNLNRLYLNPIFQNEPQVYAVKSLVEYLNLDQRLFFYFDIHGHSSTKRAFIYGNALDDIVEQTQSQVFCKLMEMNTKFFDYEGCNFSQQQMNSKDKDQSLTKQRCSRVIVNKITNIIHSLTLQVGLHYIQKQSKSEKIESNIQFKYKNYYLCKKQKQSNELLAMYSEVGRSLLISILDILDKNPYSILYTNSQKNITTIRKSIGYTILQNQQRFKKLDVKAFQKVKLIYKYVQEVFFDKINCKWDCLASDKQFISYEWPTQGLKWFRNLKRKKQYKKITIKNNQVSQQLQLYEMISNKLVNQIQQQIDFTKQIYSKSIEPMQKQKLQLNIKQIQLPKILNDFKLNVNNLGSLFLKKRSDKVKTQKSQNVSVAKQIPSKIKISESNKIGPVSTELTFSINRNITNICNKGAQQFQQQKKNNFKFYSRNLKNKIDIQIKTSNNAQNQKIRKIESIVGVRKDSRTSSHKVITKQNFETDISDDQTPLNQYPIKQNKRYQKSQDEQLTIKQRNIKYNKRQLINVKLSQLKKRQIRNSQSKLPQIKRINTDLSQNTYEQNRKKCKIINLSKFNDI